MHPSAQGSQFDASAVYSEAALDYEAAAGDFWAFLTRRTHELLALSPGDRVLDVMTGTGLLLPLAAASVGTEGSVLGVDFASGMLRVAEEKVVDLPVVQLALADVTDLPQREFDAVACVLGLFFVDDMPGFVRSLEARLSERGRLVVAVFGEDFYEPLMQVFVGATRAEAPEVPVLQPWRRTATLESFASIFSAAGAGDVTIEEEAHLLPIDDDGWRRIAHGSGLRRTLDALGPVRAERVLDRCGAAIQGGELHAVRVTARYAVLTR
jgi:ubiquinone/menaquinone biosynthesis C-methylase UbiE